LVNFKFLPEAARFQLLVCCNDCMRRWEPRGVRGNL
jgi:hypothetical protein